MSKTAQEKVRVYLLAKEVNVDTKQLLDYCKELGFAQVKNQLSGLETEQVDALRERIKKGPKAGTATAAVKTALPPPTKIENRVRTLAPPKPVVKPAADPVVSTPPDPVVEPPVAVMEAAPVEPEPAPAPVVEPPAEIASDPSPAVAVLPPSLSSMTGRMPNLSGRPPTLGNKPLSLSGNKPQIVPPRPTPVAPPRPSTPPSVPHPSGPPRQGPPVVVPPRPGGPPQHGGPPRPAGPSHPYGPPRPGGPRPQGGSRPGGGPHEAPARSGSPRVGPPPKPGGPVKLSEDQIKRLRELSQRGQRVTKEAIKNIIDEKPAGGPGQPVVPNERSGAPGSPTRRPPTAGKPAPAAGPEAPEDEKGGDRRRPGEVAGRDVRAKGRATTGRDRKVSTDRNAVVIGTGGSVDVIESKFGSRRGPRAALLAKQRRKQRPEIIKKEGPVEIAAPITVRSLSEAIGMKAGEVILRLKKETNALYSINSAVEFDVAELIAVDKGIQLVVKKQADKERDVLEGFGDTEQDEANLVPRPPIVTIMGHVDHGKTSLLDKIRESNVVDTEAGGITQVIRAWSVTYQERPITFLDTPGHEAFTKMRARGANVTDIAVIVVSASDGVMPQTEEAISHALAAQVKVIVAINKVDLPDANVDKTRRQLYQLNLLPDDMGGEVPFIECSAKTGLGIDKLLESILLVAELEDLKADPTRPASGTCLEAYRDEHEGVMATLLVQNGTIRRGDVMLCGSTFGRVRAMYDDLGRTIEEAGPSTPVKITGLDDVPDADDPFYSLEKIGAAREVAEKRKDRRQEASINKFAPINLENLSTHRAKAKITELKLILKAEARGSVEAIKKEMEKLVHDEVRVRILHTGIGAISESDVQLALTSPDDTLVVGFNVTADDMALKLAEQRGITDKLREYDIIYKLTDDVKAALEGKLKPVEEVVHLGRAIVRDTFKISKTGTIAGCYVTSGTIERSARVRLIRDGVVLFPPTDKVVGLDSLKRFKDDAREVREGFECGLKITGYDDIKVGDVIEAFKIEVRYRTLTGH